MDTLGDSVRKEISMSQEKELAEAFVLEARSLLKDDFMPKIRKCLDLLSDEDMWWRAHETNNSVGNLLLHLAGNVRQWIISGVGGAPDHRERSKEFSERRAIPREELWSKLETAIREADAVLAAFPREWLLQKRVIQKYEKTALEAIFHVVEHFSYHTGQIIYVTKLRRGKDLGFYDL
jgi:uncharacterized damage-inducible protein DinB